MPPPSLLARPPLRETTASFCELNRLTQRERDVVFLLASGVTHVSEIAARLQLRPNTVHNHLKGIFHKTGAHSKSELLAALLQHGLEHGERRSRLRRRPRVLLLEGCHALSPRLTALGMRVHESAADGYEPAPDAPLADIVVARWPGAARAQAMQHEVATRLGSATRCLLVAEPGEADAASARGHGLAVVRPEYVPFEILLSLSDGPYERSRLLRVDAELPVVVDGQLESQLANVGFGGAFALLPAALLTGTDALSVGDGVEIAFTLPDQHRVRARAAVAWARPQGRVAWPAGVGLRFTGIDAGDQGRIEDFVRRTNIGSLAAAQPRPSSPSAAA